MLHDSRVGCPYACQMAAFEGSQDQKNAKMDASRQHDVQDQDSSSEHWPSSSKEYSTPASCSNPYGLVLDGQGSYGLSQGTPSTTSTTCSPRFGQRIAEQTWLGQ